ncbi:MAG TPA: phosphatidylglycerol lysyltransferase domain-containing protein [Candidatus Saccharimonadales bacterium]|nr:phosphatidylglycerol lysyltransferase domain-containing protein [Candidatus Saccharimonadales bacterium]
MRHLTYYRLPLTIISGSVLLSGIITIVSVLFAQTQLQTIKIVSADVKVTLLVGLSFVYLATLLKRGKHNAWLITLPLYIYLVARNVQHFIFDQPENIEDVLPAILNLLVPSIALVGLVFYRHLFTVRSEISNFKLAVRRAVIILLTTFLYGVIGFQLMDRSDFHQEIPLASGAHYTIDQFGLTTNQELRPYTKRARIFLDSLAFISVGSLFYVAISFFSPIRHRLGSHDREIEVMKSLLKKYPSSSEDYFKLWPRDKSYFFGPNYSSGLAYKVVGGAALVVGDPIGLKSSYKPLLSSFGEYCRVNDWSPSLIHTEPTSLKLYEDLGFEIQKIGEEAIIDLEHFIKHVANNKYFRNIRRRFESLNYSFEVLNPPHSQLTLDQLKNISNDWLKVPGRTERSFMMGYFSEAYMQQCPLMIIKDARGRIQAFINQVPPIFNQAEANFDLLRHSLDSTGNINDYLLLKFIEYLYHHGFKSLNMGLAPLAGLEIGEDDRSALDNLLSFVYATGNRFYSFQGLKRFKAKYEPRWEGRYIIYTGGISGFTRTMNALLRGMKLKNSSLAYRRL